jgi:hypothetical protein
MIDNSYPAKWEDATEIPIDRSKLWTPNGWGRVNIDCGYGSIHDQCFGEVLEGYICDDCITFSIENKLLEEVDRHKMDT